jgi:hypothetical protein
VRPAERTQKKPRSAGLSGYARKRGVLFRD